MANPGDIVGERYRLIRVIGEGGVGTLWEAERLDSHVSHERVALKAVSLTGADSWKTVELFEREARVLANLSHPGIPRFIDSFTGDSPSGPVLYLAQAMAPGRSLKQWIDEGGKCSEIEARAIAGALLRILIYLHGIRPPVLHRDIKPANVVRAPDGTIALVDFGAVRDQLATGASTTIVGTYGYMAPEQYRGAATIASDLYGVGATILFLVTRKNPGELPQKKLRVEIPAASGLSRPFSQWLARMLEPAPEDRFESAASALDALDRGKGAARSSRTVVLASVLGAILALGGAFVAYTELHPPLQKTAATGAPHDLPPRLALFRYGELIEERHIPAHMKALFGVAWSPDAKRAASASHDGTVTVWNTSSWESERSLGHSGPVGGVAFTPDGAQVVTAADHAVRKWNADTGELVSTLDAGKAQLTRVSVSKDGRIAVGSFDGTARTFAADGTPGTPIAHSPGKRVLAVTHSPDGTLLATGGDDGALRVWDAATGAAKRTIKAHERPIGCIAFSTDGTKLATASDDRTVRVFAADGTPIWTLKDSTDETWSVAFSPESRLLATGGKDGVLRVYQLPSLALLHQAEIRGGVLDLAFSESRFLVAGGAGALSVYRQSSSAKDVPARKTPVAPVVPESPKELALAVQAKLSVDAWHGDKEMLDDGERFAKQALAIQPKHALALVQLARIAAFRGYISGNDYKPDAVAAAHALLDQAERAEPKSYDVHVARAWAYYREKKYEQARDAAARAIAIAPERFDVDAVLAEVALKEKKPDVAIRHAQRLVEGSDDPRLLHSGWDALATAWAKTGELERADGAHHKLIELSPKDAWLHGNYANFLNGRGRYGDAIKEAEQAIALRDYGMVHVYLSHSYAGEGVEALWGKHDVERARAFFVAAQKEDPRSADAWYGLAACDWAEAVAKRDRAKIDSARKSLKKAIALAADHPEAKQALEELDAVERSL